MCRSDGVQALGCVGRVAGFWLFIGADFGCAQLRVGLFAVLRALGDLCAPQRREIGLGLLLSLVSYKTLARFR